MRWIPFVTFWQVTFDLPFALDVPAGHGHSYSREYVDGWVTVLQPAGWDEAALARLRDVIAPPSPASRLSTPGADASWPDRSQPQVASGSIGGRSPGLSAAGAAGSAVSCGGCSGRPGCRSAGTRSA